MTSPAEKIKKNAAARRWLTACAVFLFFFALYSIYHSNNYYMAYGWKCIQQFSKHRPVLDTNNHLLYPLNIRTFNDFLALFGITAKTPVAYYTHSAMLNSIAGSLGLAIFFLLLQRLTSNAYAISLWGTFLLGFSRCYLVHSTNPSEPMPGFLAAILACWLAASSAASLFRPLCAGFLLAYAMASYQSMSSVFPVLLCMFLFNGQPRAKKIRAAAAFALAFGICIFMIYKYAYSNVFGLTSSHAVKKFFELEGKLPNLNVGFHGYNFVSLPEGLVRSFSGIPFMTIDESILLNTQPSIVYLIRSGFFYLLTLLFLMSCRAFPAAWEERPLRARLFICSCLVIFTLLPAAYFDPAYTKLWLQPTAAWIALVSLLISAQMKIAGAQIKRFMAAFLLFLLSCTAYYNCKEVLLPNHLKRPDATAAEALDFLMPGDALLVKKYADGFENLFLFIFIRDRTVINLNSTNHGKPVMTELAENIKNAQIHKRPVYFLDILNLSKEEWTSSFPDVPFEEFEIYRKKSKVAGRVSGETKLHTLYIYQADSGV